jgi:hypothetical protein
MKILIIKIDLYLNDVTENFKGKTLRNSMKAVFELSKALAVYKFNFLDAFEFLALSLTFIISEAVISFGTF